MNLWRRVYSNYLGDRTRNIGSCDIVRSAHSCLVPNIIQGRLMLSKMSKLTILIIFVGSALPARLVINCANLFFAYNGHLSSAHPAAEDFRAKFIIDPSLHRSYEIRPPRTTNINKSLLVLDNVFKVCSVSLKPFYLMNHIVFWLWHLWFDNHVVYINSMKVNNECIRLCNYTNFS